MFIHQSVRFGGKQDSLIGLRVFNGGGGGGGADSNLNVPRREATLPPTKWEGGGGGMILGGRHKCMTPVGIQWFLVAQMNITN